MTSRDETGAVVWLESSWAELTVVEPGGSSIRSSTRISIPRPEDPSGKSLMRALATKLDETWARSERPQSLAVVLPGTIRDGQIVSAGRLGIRQQLDAASMLNDRLKIPVAVLHDMDCLVASDDTATLDQTVTYVYVDEGVGGLSMVNGVEIRGAGHAGVLGRMVMNPMGPWSPHLMARGILEVYCARPWLSEHMVAQYNQQKDKVSLSVNRAVAADANSKFRRALRTYASQESEATKLDFKQMADGLRDGDPIAGTVLDAAAQHLGLALSSVITLLNPHRIVLAGGLFSELPEVGEQALHLVGQYTSAKPLNATTTEMWTDAHRQVITGACRLAGSLPCQ